MYICVLGIKPRALHMQIKWLTLMYTSRAEKETTHSAENLSFEWEERDYMEVGRHTQRGPRYLLKRKVRCSNRQKQRETQEKVSMAKYATQKIV